VCLQSCELGAYEDIGVEAVTVLYELPWWESAGYRNSYSGAGDQWMYIVGTENDEICQVLRHGLPSQECLDKASAMFGDEVFHSEFLGPVVRFDDNIGLEYVGNYSSTEFYGDVVASRETAELQLYGSECEKRGGFVSNGYEFEVYATPTSTTTSDAEVISCTYTVQAIPLCYPNECDDRKSELDSPLGGYYGFEAVQVYTPLLPFTSNCDALMSGDKEADPTNPAIEDDGGVVLDSSSRSATESIAVGFLSSLLVLALC